MGNPTGFHLTPGQAHDLHGADALLNNLKAIGAFLADKAYDALERMIAKLKAADCQVVIPPKTNRTEQRPYDEDMYKWRHLIENFFQKLKQYRGIATRYDKTACNFLGAIHLVASIIWLKWWHALVGHQETELDQEACIEPMRDAFGRLNGLLKHRVPDAPQIDFLESQGFLPPGAKTSLMSGDSRG